MGMKEVPALGRFSRNVVSGTDLDKAKANRIITKPPSPLASALQKGLFAGDEMGERRKARRYEVALPLQVFTSRHRPTEFHTAQLRDISRTGLYFHSNVPVDTGTPMELTFALPGEKDRGTSVLVRASARVLRVNIVDSDSTPIYGVAATIDRLDFVRPVVTNAA